MTANKHTPQEWLRDGTTVYSLNVEGTNRFSAQVQGGWATSGRNRTEASELEANARLIAAAPELLEALKDILSNCLDSDGLSRAHENARAAIAKATGVQP